VTLVLRCLGADESGRATIQIGAGMLLENQGELIQTRCTVKPLLGKKSTGGSRISIHWLTPGRNNSKGSYGSQKKLAQKNDNWGTWRWELMRPGPSQISRLNPSSFKKKNNRHSRTEASQTLKGGKQGLFRELSPIASSPRLNRVGISKKQDAEWHQMGFQRVESKLIRGETKRNIDGGDSRRVCVEKTEILSQRCWLKLKLELANPAQQNRQKEGGNLQGDYYWVLPYLGKVPYQKKEKKDIIQRKEV